MTVAELRRLLAGFPKDALVAVSVPDGEDPLPVESAEEGYLTPSSSFRQIKHLKRLKYPDFPRRAVLMHLGWSLTDY